MNPDALPAFADFSAHYQNGKTQLVWQWVSGDLETPVSAYLKLCKNNPYCFLLESVEGGAKLGRYSIIGFDPDLIWQCLRGKVTITGGMEDTNNDPVQSLRQTIRNSHIDIVSPELPPMAMSGLFGYLGYDMIRLIEKVPDNNPDDLKIPDSILIRPRVLAIFDNIKNMICLVTPVYNHAGNSDAGSENIYKAAAEKIRNAIKSFSGTIANGLISAESKLKTPLDVSSNMTQKEYSDAVNRAVDYIHQGEIFQAVLGQRFTMDFDLPSFDLYRALRKLNPSPFMFHLSFENFSLVGSSPEILVRVRDNTVTIRPIAGTRKRGATPEEDKALSEDLLTDAKECSEHLMLLDLGRNDVGRVAEFSTVKVTEKFKIEYYSHVMHIVSNIEGRLRANLDIVDALFAGFPAGTVSGAPKVRAMEIIDELENNRRAYYGGGVGYFSGNGEMDSCIALRTALVKDGKIYVQAGAGIVADSNPVSEYQETVNKARAIIRAAEMAIEQARK